MARACKYHDVTAARYSYRQLCNILRLIAHIYPQSWLVVYIRISCTTRVTRIVYLGLGTALLVSHYSLLSCGTGRKVYAVTMTGFQTAIARLVVKRFKWFGIRLSWRGKPVKRNLTIDRQGVRSKCCPLCAASGNGVRRGARLDVRKWPWTKHRISCSTSSYVDKDVDLWN